MKKYRTSDEIKKDIAYAKDWIKILYGQLGVNVGFSLFTNSKAADEIRGIIHSAIGGIDDLIKNYEKELEEVNRIESSR
jgi:hypothetical protein